jgi:hypothetical protein
MIDFNPNSRSYLPSPRRFFGLALLAAASLLLEIELTRLFATIYYPPYVYVLLALALLGLGLGAALAAAQARLCRAAYVAAYAAAAGMTTLGVTVLMLRLPSPDWQWLQLMLATLPFVAIGLAVATIFSTYPTSGPRLYAADLGGAGVGALLAVPLIDALQVPGSLFLTGLTFFLVAMLWAESARWPWLLGMCVFALLVVMVVATNVSSLNIVRLGGEKPLATQLQRGATPIDSVWDSFARTDLVDPGSGEPYELYLDGAAGSVMPPTEGHPALWRDIGLFPFATEQPARVFLIGPGGGLDVWFAQQANAQVIDAVEVNRASVALARAQSDYNGSIYDQPNVRVLIDEGRSVLARAQSAYDLIFLSHVVTLAAERGGLTLVENGAFTQEAFATYLTHLTSEGVLAIKLYDELTLSRALATVLAVLNQRGLSDAEALMHVITLLDARTDPPIPLLMVRNTPYSREDALALGAVAREVGFTPLFLPEVVAQPPLDAVAAGTQSFAQVIEGADDDLTPVTDDRPFFYHFESSLPQTLQRLLWGLLVVVGLGVGGVLLFLQRFEISGLERLSPIYFAALGAGFMAVEIGLIQQTRLLLGHPGVTLAAVLGVLLLGGGAGSLLLAGRSSALPRGALIGVIALILAWVGVWPSALEAALAWPSAARIGLTVVAILPLAFFMGAPFPAGLRWVGVRDGRLVALAWAVNGVMGVAGAAGALALAMLIGYRSVLLAGAALYVLALQVALIVKE